MKRLLLTALLLPATALAEQPPLDSCEQLGLFAFGLIGCPQHELNVNLDTPLCQQPGLENLAYLDSRCYQEVPFDASKPCYEWDCPAPYDHVMVEPLSGRTKIVRGSAEEIDQHYRAARQQLGALLIQARTAVPAKKKSSKR